MTEPWWKKEQCADSEDRCQEYCRWPDCLTPLYPWQHRLLASMGLKERRRPVLTVLVGIPGSGKSTWAEEYTRENQIEWVSSDAIRLMMTGDMRDLSQDDKVWPHFFHRLEKALACGRDVVADSTGLWKPSRQRMLTLANYYEADIHALVFMATDAAVERNMMRSDAVPLVAMKKMLDQRAEMLETIEQEGFTQVRYMP